MPNDFQDEDPQNPHLLNQSRNLAFALPFLKTYETLGAFFTLARETPNIK